MRPALSLLFAIACADPGFAPPPAGNAPRDTGVTAAALPALSMTVLASGLADPFEVIVGPDGWLWVTERTGGRVTRIDPADGSQAVALTLADVLITAGTQDGLMGLALHPKLLRGKGKDYVYLAYTYDADATATVDRRVKLVRYTWDAASSTLVAPKTLISGLPGSTDHNSGRLLFGPDRHLYYTIGDQGNNQFSRFCLHDEAQTLPTAAQVASADWSAYQGKVLRLELDGSIPIDNPVIGGVRSHLWTFGHRNPQGLAFAADGTLLEAEHGPKTDDELNVLSPGGNYGWPDVVGFQDDSAYVYGNWSASKNPPCSDLTYSDFEIPPSVPISEEHEFADPAFVEPVRTFYTVPDDFDFQDPACAASGVYFVCWPTIAPSSIAPFEGHPHGITGLEGSLLITSLKLGNLYAVPLASPAGDGEPPIVFHTVDRYRRITVSANGKALYVATDVSGYAMGDDGAPTTSLAHPGSILVLSE